MLFLTGDAAGSEKGWWQPQEQQLPCWDVHIPPEMCPHCCALELAPRFVCAQRQLLALPALQCLVWGVGVLGCCAGLPCGPCGPGLGSVTRPFLALWCGAFLGAWGRRRSLDMSETGQIMELNLSGAHHLQQVPLWVSGCVSMASKFGAGPSGHHQQTQLVDSPPLQGAAGSETSLGGCHSTSWLPGDSVTQRGWHRAVPDKSCKGRI